MKQTQIIMGMPVTVEIIDAQATLSAIAEIFAYFVSVDQRFSTYKTDSEVSRFNRKELSEASFSPQLRKVFQLCQQTKLQTRGFFDPRTPQGFYDPSGLVKGWAIFQAALMLKAAGYRKFFVEAGGDIQACAKEPTGNPWRVGIRNPFNRAEIVKVINLQDEGLATSGTYIRGQHIYNPHRPGLPLTEIVSLTVIGKNIYEADRFATAAFAMGREGINFIEELDGLEAYQIDQHGLATQTSGFYKYLAEN